MESETKLLLAEALGATCLVAGYLLYAGNVESTSTQPKELTGDENRSSEQQNQPETGPSGTSEATNSTNSIKIQENIPEYTKGYITRDTPRSRFLIVPDPKNQGRKCVAKTNETPMNTLVGMTVVLGKDKDKYDGSGIIYDGAGNQIGAWDAADKLIGFEDLSAPAYADAVACENN